MVKHLKAFFLELGNQFPWGSRSPFRVHSGKVRKIKNTCLFFLGPMKTNKTHNLLSLNGIQTSLSFSNCLKTNLPEMN